MDKTRRPDILRPGSFLTVFPKPGLHPPGRVLLAQLQAQRIVNGTCLFVLMAQFTRCTNT